MNIIETAKRLAAEKLSANRATIGLPAITPEEISPEWWHEFGHGFIYQAQTGLFRPADDKPRDGCITSKQADILAHANDTGRYVTGEKEVFDLAAAGLLNDHGGTGFWPKGTRGFTISRKGRDALREWRAAQPPPQKPKRRRQSPQFEAWQSFCDGCKWMPFAQFVKEVWPHRMDYR